MLQDVHYSLVRAHLKTHYVMGKDPEGQENYVRKQKHRYAAVVLVPRHLVSGIRERHLHERFTAVVWNNVAFVSLYLPPTGSSENDDLHQSTLNDRTSLLARWKTAGQWQHLI
eukprot:8849739-Lingulodinium_polyedra.AAC.1